VAALVAHGFGVSLMPRLVRIPSELPVLRVPIDDAPARRLLTCTRRGSRGQRPIALGLDAPAEVSAGPGTPARASARPASRTG
jgi:hypothetical protein